MAKRSIPKRFHLKDPELAKAVAAALADCKEVKAHQRLLAVRMAASGQFTAQQIAEQLGISRRRLFDWIKMLKAGGLPGLLACDHGGGAAPRITGAVREELQAACGPCGGNAPRRCNTGYASAMRKSFH